MTDDEQPLYILLVDDHEVVRKGLRLLLETVLGYEVAEAASGDEALGSINTRIPDLVLLDARMPERDGIWTLQRIRQDHESLPVIILSTYDTSDYVNGAIDNGADGYLLKDASSQQLQEAIDSALAGDGLYLQPQVARRLFGRQGRSDDLAELSQRELTVLTELISGRSTNEIGEQLHLAPKTVKAHLTSIFRKLGVSNRTQAVAKAMREGLTEDW
ncbi:MAG: response regulator transcription factor [Acidimicrobiia bacterium]